MERNWERSIALPLSDAFWVWRYRKKRRKSLVDNQKILQTKGLIKRSTHVLKSLTPFLILGFWQLSELTLPLSFLALCKKVWCFFLWYPKVRSNHANTHPHVRMYHQPHLLTTMQAKAITSHAAQGIPDKCVHLPFPILCKISLFISFWCMCDMICLGIWRKLQEECVIPLSTVLREQNGQGMITIAARAIFSPLTCKLDPSKHALGPWLSCLLASLPLVPCSCLLVKLGFELRCGAFTKSYQVSVLGLCTQVASLKNWWQEYEIEILSKNGAGLCVSAYALCLRYLVLLFQHQPWLSHTQENDPHSLTTGCFYQVLLSILWNAWEIDTSSVPDTSPSGIHSCEKKGVHSPKTRYPNLDPRKPHIYLSLLPMPLSPKNTLIFNVIGEKTYDTPRHDCFIPITVRELEDIIP